MAFKVVDSMTAWKTKHEDSDVGCVRMSSNDRTVAVGCFNGNVYVRATQDSRLMYRIQAVSTASPITALRWHPKILSTIVCGSASGFVSSWHTETGQNLWTIEEQDNAINSVDISPDGTHFTTSGSECKVRYYDLSSRERVLELATKKYMQGKVSGHELRIFASIFMDNNTIASSGWDDTVLLWDVRTGTVTRSIFGTHICGEAICFANGNTTMITGSWRDEDQIQCWDIGSGKLMDSVTIADERAGKALQVYSLAITKDNEYLAAAGSGMNCVAFYRVEDMNKVATTPDQEACVTSVHLGTRKFAFGMSDSNVYVDGYGESS